MGKKTSLTTKMSFYHSGKMSIFPKGITHDFPHKFIMFKYVLNKKKLSRLQKCHFNILGT